MQWQMAGEALDEESSDPDYDLSFAMASTVFNKSFTSPALIFSLIQQWL